MQCSYENFDSLFLLLKCKFGQSYYNWDSCHKRVHFDKDAIILRIELQKSNYTYWANKTEFELAKIYY